MNWYVGQRVVAIASLPGIFKEGDEFNIVALEKTSCKCGYMLIDVGIRIKDSHTKGYCSKCGATEDMTDGIGWLSEYFFSPLEGDISELTEILEMEMV